MAGQDTFASSLHKAARAWADAGFAVFPCVPLGKEPATHRGFLDATTNPETIDGWWRYNPRYNIGVYPEHSAMFVLDEDPPLGAETLARLTKDHGLLPDTLTIRTPRGGSHYWFQGHCKSTVGTEKNGLGPKLDTRGEGGYVLLPPSHVIDKAKGIDGCYEITQDVEIAEGPEWIADRAAVVRDRVAAQIETLDLPSSVDRARTLLRNYVQAGDVAIEGSGGDNRTYQVCAEVLNMGLSPERAVEVIDIEWNAHCIPPWTRDEIAGKVANASNYSQNDAGAWTVPPSQEVFTALDLSGATDVAQAPRSRFYAEDVREQETAPNPSWVIPQVIADATTVLLIGPKGNFKSFIAEHILCAVASGKPMFEATPIRSGPTFYGAHEGRSEIKRARRNAWEAMTEMSGKFYPFYVLPGPKVAIAEECEAFREAIRVRLREPGAKKIAGIVLDTVAKCMIGLDENSAKDAGVFVQFCDDLAFEFECPVIALHHTKKDGSTGARGSGAIEAGFGTVLDVKRDGKHVEVWVRYHKDAEEREFPWNFKATKFGSNIAFEEVSTAAYMEEQRKHDPLHRLNIGAALRELGAIGAARSITTNVLASHIVPALESDDADDHQAAIRKITKRLLLLSRSRLEAYVKGDGKDLRWALPDQEPDTE